MATAAPLANEMINTPAEATGEYKEMLVRLLTRQIYAETATSEVFGKAITAAPNWQEKELAAEFAAEEARHALGHKCYMDVDLQRDAHMYAMYLVDLTVADMVRWD